MGCYASLTVNDYQIMWWKNGLDELALSLFSVSDCQTYEAIEEDGAVLTHKVVRVSAQHMRERLSIMGFGLSAAKQNFGQHLQSEFTDTSEDGEDSQPIDNEMTFENWSEFMQEIIKRNLSTDSLLPDDLPYVENMKSLRYGHYFCFPCDDIRFCFQAILSLFSPDAVVELDYTDLENWDNTDWTSLFNPPKTIILTEGISDSRILKQALEKRFAYLQDYFSFLDFDV